MGVTDSVSTRNQPRRIDISPRVSARKCLRQKNYGPRGGESPGAGAVQVEASLGERGITKRLAGLPGASRDTRRWRLQAEIAQRGSPPSASSDTMLKSTPMPASVCEG